MDDLYFKTIPIIAFTASEIPNVKAKAFGAGMTGFTTKPLRQEDLVMTIDKYVFENMENGNDLRPLNIDFDQYTDGDADFKQELVSLMIDDIGELQKSLAQATASNDPEIFLRGCHKSKTTVEMVSDKDLTLLLAEMGEQIIQDKYLRSAVLQDKILLFNKLTYVLLKSLSGLLQQNA